MSYFAGNYDIAVIGAGHAGIEAGARGRAAGAAGRRVHDQSGRRGQHALQPGHRRHGQGPSRARARRPRRRDGPRGGRLLHPVPHAQPRQGPGRALPARAGRPPPLSGAHEAPARARAEPLSQAGRRHGDPDGGRTRQRRRDAARRGIPRARRHRRGRDVPRQHRHHRASASCIPGRTACAPRRS